jgi:hypothetical protein
MTDFKLPEARERGDKWNGKPAPLAKGMSGRTWTDQRHLFAA